ncbi:hypothetical protein COCOBI_01-7920 [Coccomyxa sp. Obi]|nr:hypothetical protein COCOBI_01-7920 [Coccomyxa sp. Obi]
MYRQVFVSVKPFRIIIFHILQCRNCVRDEDAQKERGGAGVMAPLCGAPCYQFRDRSASKLANHRFMWDDAEEDEEAPAPTRRPKEVGTSLSAAWFTNVRTSA